ncbi:hypothetical protein L596_011808 [Steinernema carpocapsae]|uniref:Crossover junction endonuclease MUS81 n=1 Tax=Steinernema carpocapsae TaxID=34508 RepID=A0A4U5NVF3_STECR|nr:hypothetical protein L596_011808 [Steinernema carpocapsae]
MGKRQLTIRREYPQKMFYEKILQDWKESIEDRNQRVTVNNAHQSIKRYPIEINGFADLKNIKGIGNNIATKLDNAWQLICCQYQMVPTLVEIKQLKKGEFLQFVQNKKSRAVPVSSGQAAPIPIAPFEVPSTSSTAPSTSTAISMAVRLPDMFPSNSSVGLTRNPSVIARNLSQNSDVDEVIRYLPHDHSKVEVCLIVDNREKSGMLKKKDVSVFLDKLKTRYELRSLSVGDYLWVLRWKDTGREMVMDYICERKTWDDLWQSIRKGRFDDQKQRLRNCEVDNIVLIVEGTCPTFGRSADGPKGTQELAVEQALASANVGSNFMVQRTANIEGTAKFLDTVTNRLMNRIQHDNVL